jgi:hypothetical protein
MNDEIEVSFLSYVDRVNTMICMSMVMISLIMTIAFIFGVLRYKKRGNNWISKTPKPHEINGLRQWYVSVIDSIEREKEYLTQHQISGKNINECLKYLKGTEVYDKLLQLIEQYSGTDDNLHLCAKLEVFHLDISMTRASGHNIIFGCLPCVDLKSI